MEDKQYFVTMLKVVEQCERELGILCRQYREGEIGMAQFFKELAVIVSQLPEAEEGRKR